MTQAHSIYLKNTDFNKISSIEETDLSPSVIRHLKALRIRTTEELHFMDGQGSFLNVRCIQTQPYKFEILVKNHHTQINPLLHLYLSAPRKDSLGQSLSQATEM